MMKWDLRIALEDGMEIKALGMPSVFQGSGSLHFRVTEVELVGAGALAKQFEMLKRKLEAEGLFAPERKRPIPRFPETVGLVTSVGAAAYDDVLRVLRNRWGGIEILFYPVSVQGFGAVESIVEAFEWFNKIVITPPNLPLKRGGNCGVDVLILTRGGGSLEDLQAFNSEAVARAVFGSRTPVVCGVGHERDISIADMVADVRAATPSNAAELTVPDRREVVQQVAYSVERMTEGLERIVEEKKNTIEHAMEVGARFVERYKERLDHFVRTLENLNPLNILKRGYSVVTKAGRVLKDSASAEIGDDVDIRLYKGGFTGKVTARLT